MVIDENVLDLREFQGNSIWLAQHKAIFKEPFIRTEQECQGNN